MLEGIWVAASATLGGEPVPRHLVDAMTLELFEGNYSIHNDRGRYTADVTRTPNELDLTGLEGPNTGRTIVAIFDLRESAAGDQLTICYDVTGDVRPVRFESASGTLELLIHFTRAALA
jgi:uncharacterized protein (TIGR03067 family)